MWTIAGAENRIIACREWLLRKCDHYACACVRVLIFTPRDLAEDWDGSNTFHPCVTGELVPHAERWLDKNLKSYADHARQLGYPATEVIKEWLQNFHFELTAARRSATALGDWTHSDGDWVPACIGTFSAKWEQLYREELELPPFPISLRCGRRWKH
jgi:hypothetical protein